MQKLREQGHSRNFTKISHFICVFFFPSASVNRGKTLLGIVFAQQTLIPNFTANNTLPEKILENNPYGTTGAYRADHFAMAGSSNFSCTELAGNSSHPQTL